MSETQLPHSNCLFIVPLLSLYVTIYDLRGRVVVAHNQLFLCGLFATPESINTHNKDI